MIVSYYWNVISSIGKAYHTHKIKVMEHFELSSIETDILLFLANNPDCDTASSIVRNRRMAKSHVSKAVGSLYEKKLITKTPDPENAKKIHLSLTGRAEKIAAYGQEQQLLFLSQILRGFSREEEQTFLNDLRRISENIEHYYKF